MATLLLACALLGGTVLVLQLILGLVGAGTDHDLHHPSGLDDGLHLLTVRGVAAALAFFGITGRGLLAAGWSILPATAVAVGAGLLAALATAWAMRLLRNLESDGVVRLERAVGQSARVHVRVPGGRGQPGKVLLTLQDRLVELPAVSLDGELATGTPVTVVGLADAGTVEVVRTPDPGA